MKRSIPLVFNHNKQTKVVHSGRELNTTCPACRQRTRFVEVEVSEKLGLYFLELLGDKERKLMCTACASIFDLPDTPEPTKATPMAELANSAWDLERKQPANYADLIAAKEQLRAVKAKAKAEAEARTKAKAKANRIEDELAEMKRRIGR